MKICLVCEGVCETTQPVCATCGRRLLDTEAVHFPRRRGEEDASNPWLGAIVDGKYRILSVLGKGGMGTVFRATHEVSLVPVALKILNPRFSARREYREFFVAEAQKAGRVIHEHSARIMDVGEAEDGTVYIAMEIVNGVTLHDCIHGETPLSPVQVVDILLQICDALAAAHQSGLVHRDLSTRNVMVVSRQGSPFVKILDFGIAKVLPLLKTSDSSAPVAVAPMGFASPPYSAPEQLEGHNVDARADLYSLGVIGYEALARRFPVAGTTGKELAEATLRGELLPLDAPPGATQHLVRLLWRLLARDPDQRPHSALAVQAELRRIRQPGSPRTLSVASFAIALVLVMLAFAVPQERECVIQPGSIDVTPPGSAPELQVIQGSAIEHLRFDYAGFRPEDIVVEIQAGDARRRRPLPLPGVVAANGVVDLAPPGAALDRVRQVLRAASRDQPVDLIFRWRDRPPFGIARLRVDDEDPDVRFGPKVRLPDHRVLSGRPDHHLGLVVSDRSPLKRLTLTCYDLASGEEDVKPGKNMALDPNAVEVEIRPAQVLAGLHSGPRPSGPVGLVVTAVDAAGNSTVTRRLDFDAMDFAVPEILSRRVVAFHDERSAELLLRVDEVEPELEARVTGPGGKTRLLPVELPGGRLLLIKLARPVDRGFVSGTYRVELADPAGNVSREPFGIQIDFRNIDANVRFELSRRDPETAALPMVELTDPDCLVWDGREISFALACDRFYRPCQVGLEPGETRLPGDVARLLDAAPGRARIQLGAVENGSYELELVLETLDSEDRKKEQLLRKTLVVVRDPLVLHLGGAAAGPSGRYLPGLRNLFRVEKDLEPGGPVLRQGPSWNLVPDLPGLVRGSVLTGGSTLVPTAIHPRGQTSGELLPPLDVRIGRNVVFLDLVDVLGRPVVVEAQGTRRSGRCKIADFYHFEELARPRTADPAIQLEAGQDARLVLDSPYPFTAGDQGRIVLQFPRTRPIPARVRHGEREGTVLEFDVPYDELRRASALDEETLRQEGREFEVAPDLETPAGKQPLHLRVRTIRSALASCSLGELFPAAPEELCDIVMVPVLSPRAEFEDPVAGDLVGRGKFRPHPPINVRNIQDCYLQQGELTRRQYAALVTQALPTLPGSGDAWRQLVFPGDPEGRDRLSAEGMVPAVHGNDVAAWRRRLRTGPERPVSGVSFHQAYTVTRLAGWLLARRPGLFRLPLGVEMELAALGTERSSGRLNGSGAGSGAPTYAHHRRASERMALASWPPTRSESQALGDRVPGPRGTLVGLDYGVREWVLDLPWLKHPVVGILQSEHPRHLRAATGFLQNKELRPVHKELCELGVVRGLALGEVAQLPDPDATGVLPATVPGVVRTLHMRRDGSGALPDELDPHLGKVGLRLCGGTSFISVVRRR